MLDFIKQKLSFYNLCLIFVFFVMVFLVINEWMNGKNDAFFEEAVEDVIENETGIRVDLTPTSKE